MWGDKRPHRFVYGVRFGRYVKIGTTRTPHIRLRQLTHTSQRGPRSPVDLQFDDIEPLFAVAGDHRTERLLHLIFEADRVTGEWFWYRDRIAAAVKGLRGYDVWPFLRVRELNAQLEEQA